LGRITEVGSHPANTWQLGTQAGVPPRRVRCSVDGILGIRRALPRGVPSEGPLRVNATLHFFGADQQHVGTHEVVGEDRYFRAGSTFPRPLGRRTVIAGSGGWYVIGTQDSPEVLYMDAEGTPLHILRWPGRTLEVGSYDIETYVNRLVTESPDQAAQIRSVYRDHEFPESLPAFGRLILDESGRLWVEETQRPGISANSWQVFSKFGKPLATVDFPERFTPYFVTADRVAGVWQDALGVEYVWVFDFALERD